MSTKPELKSCPFCGSEAHASHSRTLGFAFGCSSTDCSTQPLAEFYQTEEAAIAAWNRRSGEAPLDAAAKQEVSDDEVVSDPAVMNAWAEYDCEPSDDRRVLRPLARKLVAAIRLAARAAQDDGGRNG